jgi:glycosyltransferase involved in cell wall biosynthesis
MTLPVTARDGASPLFVTGCALFATAASAKATIDAATAPRKDIIVIDSRLQNLGFDGPRPEKVAILVPAWNAASTLPAALHSICRQTYVHWECVVVDDGSTDDTVQVARQFARADARFSVTRLSHGGLVRALNEGLAQCRAPLIARMDADDIMHRDRLSHQVAALATHPDWSAVGCHVRIFPRTRMSPRLREYETWLNGLRSADDIARDAYVECPVAHPTLMMRQAMADLGYADHAWPEDYDLILRALTQGRRIGVVSRRLVAWRDRPDSLCRTAPSYDVSRFTACKAHYLALGFLSRADQYVLWGYGDTGRALRRALALHGKTPSHIVEVKTSRIGQRIHGAPVIPISQLASLRGQPVVVSVARAAPRAEIRSAMRTLHFIEGVDFVCAA